MMTPRLASSSGGLPSAVRWSQLLLEDRLRPGDVVVDATLGNGHDTLFLCRQVLPGGHVYGFDVQAAAVESTGKRLLEAGVAASDFSLFQAGHETMPMRLPEGMREKLAAVMFNLGYLPGSDKQCITQTETTMVALKQAVEGGAEEAVRIAEWAGTLDARAFEVQHLRPVNRTAAPPECWVIWKRGF